MTRWETIIKNKLESYQSTLPIDGLAEFNALRETAGLEKKHSFAGWVVSSIGVAAALSVVILIGVHKENDSDTIANIIETSGRVIVPMLAEEYVSEPPSAVTTTLPKLSEPFVAIEEVPEQETEKQEPPHPKPQSQSPNIVADQAMSKGLPLQSSDRMILPTAGAAAAGVVGAELIGAILANRAPQAIIRSSLSMPDIVFLGAQNGIISTSNELGEIKYYSPVKLGLSFSFPVSSRFSLTFGPELISFPTKRSLFDTSFEAPTHTLFLFHYLGLPVRLDYIIARNNLFDVFMGGGIEPDFYLCKTSFKIDEDHSFQRMVLDNNKQERIEKYGISLILAGGIQLNLSNRLSIYFEPGLSWNILYKNRELPTYGREHPLVFTTSTGLRIKLK